MGPGLARGIAMSLTVLALLGATPNAQARDLGTPLPPLDVRATATDAGVLVTWLPPAAEGTAPVESYHVYRLDGPTGGWQEVGATGADGRSLLDASAADDGGHGGLVYSVRAANDNGASLPSAPAAAGSSSPCIEMYIPPLQVPPGGVDPQCVVDLLTGLLPRCHLIGIAGFPPQVGINWSCLPHPNVQILYLR
jgi:hypothetical protein